MKPRSPSLKPVPSPLAGELHQVLNPYGVGIDTHSKFIQVCILMSGRKHKDATRVERHEKEFPTSWHGLLSARRWTLSVLKRKAQPDTLRYCIESTGTYHLPVLRAWGGLPSVVNPMLTGPTRRKTDVLDARLLAHYSITGFWPSSFIPTEQQQVLRILWASRREAIRMASRHSNRINNIVLRFGHTFGAQHVMRSAEGQAILEDLILGRAPSVPGVCPHGLDPTVRPVIQQLLAALRHQLAEVKRTTAEALAYIRSTQWPTGTKPISGVTLLELLQTVPGVGEATALTWLAEVCDPRRFQNAKQVAAFCGCDPSLKVSAGKVTSHVRRHGNERLHQALLFAASGVLRLQASPMADWGRSIRGRHKAGGHRKACGAVARRIGTGLWHVHRKAEPFSYDQYTFAQAIVVPDTPLSAILRPPAVRLLADHAIKTAQDLANAYNQGTLADIAGFGSASLNAVSTWVQQHGKRVRLPAELPPAPAASAPPSPSKSSSKDYRLHPPRHFQPRATTVRQNT
jgi:transposase